MNNYLEPFIVALVAMCAPLIAELVPFGVLPPVVLEVLGGVVLGPQVLGVVHIDEPVSVLSFAGLGFLLFLAGMELLPGSLVSRQARTAFLIYGIALVAAFPLALGLKAAGAHGDLRILALALTSTSLGVLVPVLRDARASTTGFGQTVLVTASVGEFASLALLTVLFSADPKSTPVQVVYVVGLAVAGVLATLLFRWWWRSPWFTERMDRLADTMAQLRVRTTMVLLLGFASLVTGFGLDAVLGAFVAGIVLRAAMRDMDPGVEERFVSKLNAIGFGFLIPFFFVATGIRLDVGALEHDPATVALVPLFLAAMVVARGVTTAVVLRGRLTLRGTLANGAFQATSLTFPVIVATIGQSLHFLAPGTAAALIAAGLLSVVVLPAVALLLRPWEGATGLARSPGRVQPEPDTGLGGAPRPAVD